MWFIDFQICKFSVTFPFERFCHLKPDRNAAIICEEIPLFGDNRKEW